MKRREKKKKCCEPLCVLRWRTLPLFKTTCVKGGDFFEEAKNNLVLKQHVLAYFLACRGKCRVFQCLVFSAMYVSRETGLCTVTDDRSSVAAEYSSSLQFL